VKPPTREEVLERARALVPALRQRPLEADRNRGIPVETHQAFASAGFYKLFQPARHGGHEMDPL
jgi:3-hydroxy-9,10-secoandrosta-1,3,5(10)-triene-9,17-dione monooxygenase